MAGKKILVVDDSDIFQKTLSEVLSVSGFTVVIAANGKEGLEKISKESPDLILLDCIMPEMDGYEVVKNMREDPALCNMPVIMITGRDSEFDEVKGLAFGIDDYIIKPFNPSVLVARINAILERKAQSISANPLTLLCGNVVIKAETEKRLTAGVPFSMLYVDLNSFKSFNDKYGFQRGDEVIKETANILLQAVKNFGKKGDFVGHIGGDDFIILTTPESYKNIAENIIENFDKSITNYYDNESKKLGYIVSTDRQNIARQFPFMTISIAVISTDMSNIAHYGQLSEIAADLKKLAKQQNRSAYVIDRRRGEK